MIMRSLPLVTGLLLFGLLSSARGQTVLAPVTLTEDGIVAAGIRLEKLQAVRHAPTVGAFGQVVDPARLAALTAQSVEAKADIAAAEAKGKLAQDEAKRTASLYRAQGNVSMADYQSAQSAEQVATASQVVAKAKLRALEAGIRATGCREASCQSAHAKAIANAAQRLDGHRRTRRREASPQTRDHRFQGVQADIIVKAVEPVLKRVLDHRLSGRSDQFLQRQRLETRQIERTITRRG
jgi:hypothetical protein